MERIGPEIFVSVADEGEHLYNKDRDNLVRKIEEKDAIISIVGLGQVGLPTALSFINAGFSVIGYDIDQKLTEELSRGRTRIPEKGVKEILESGLSTNRISFTNSSTHLLTADVVIICVPTPLSSEKQADLSYLKESITEIADKMNSRKLIIVESSIPPLTMINFIIPLLEKLSSKKTSNDYLIAYCPERISPGSALKEIVNNTRLIGVSNEASYAAASTLYRQVSGDKIIRTNFTTAEVSKLAENSFRDVNIAFANELALICRDLEVDVLDVIKLANTHPRVSIHMPGSGVGGPCLPKDPYLLISNSNRESSLIKTARSMNDSIPGYIVKILKDHVLKSNGAKNLKIGLLGIAYKPNVHDDQNSPAKYIIEQLEKRDFHNITVHDPLRHDSFGVNFCSDLRSVLKDSDCIIIATGHTMYASIKPTDVKKNCIIIDAARILKREEFVANDRRFLSI